MKFYLIGIKGTGMAALAQILYDDGHNVKGLDVEDAIFTQDELSKKNITIETIISHDFSIADMLVIGHNFMRHPIMEEIEKSHIPYMEYHKFLAAYISDLWQIAVSGTHGKTTTVGYFYHTLKENFPTSMLRGDGTGIGGNNDIMVYEACEYQKHFLAYHPHEIIITNIDYDHSDFFPTIEIYQQAFQEYVQGARRVYIHYDDKDKITHNCLITYGDNPKADYYWKNLDLSVGIHGEAYYRKEKIGDIDVPIYGQYNADHILALVAFLHEHYLNINSINKGLAKFSGVKRRLEIKINNDDVFIDDYAHHPAEIVASIATVRLMFPSLRVVAIFKPDRYSRLIEFKDDFKKALHQADDSYVLPLYEKIDKDEMGSALLKEEGIQVVEKLEDLNQEETDHQKTVYLFMSSKNIDYWLYNFEKHLHKHC